MRVRRAMGAGVLAALGLALTGCPAVAPADSCRRDDECPAAYRCVQGLCVRRAADGSSAEASALDAPRVDGAHDAAAPDRAVADRAPDGALPDAQLTDTAAPDLLSADAAVPDSWQADAAAPEAGPADSSSVDTGRDAAPADLAVPDLGAGPDTATPPDAALPDLGTPDAGALDLSPLDQQALPDTASPADTCVPDAGSSCPRSGYCGATLDCTGQCVGGTTAPACPECGARTCQALQTWSDCNGGVCGTFSTCNPATGSCDCFLSETCSAAYCCGTDVCCEADAYGCRYDTVTTTCGDHAPCDGQTSSCGGQTCGLENCAGCCTRDGTCLDGYSNYACGVFGSQCDDCSSHGDGCQFWDCTQNRECELYSYLTNGTVCGPGRQCWSGACTTCVPQTGNPCTVSCNCGGFWGGFPGSVGCTGTCMLPAGCSCASACLGPC